MMRAGEALEYVEQTYGVRLSRPTLIRYLKQGKLRGGQPGGPHAWWVISRQSIDELFGKGSSRGADS
jgi:hypothetical protein